MRRGLAAPQLRRGGVLTMAASSVKAPSGLRDFSPAQTRAARALLDWSRAELAFRATVNVNAIARFEDGQRDLTTVQAHRLRDAFEQRDVIAIPGRSAGEGVRFRRRAGHAPPGAPWRVVDGDR